MYQNKKNLSYKFYLNCMTIDFNNHNNNNLRSKKKKK